MYYKRTYQSIVSKMSNIMKHKKQSLAEEENKVVDEEITMPAAKKETFEIWKEFDSQVCI